MSLQDPFEWLDSLGSRGIVPGLDRIDDLAARLGNPERRFPSVLVAGTNGKGSTAASLDAILLASGLRSGFYSSPHLLRLNERLRIAGKPVGMERLAAALDEVRRVMEGASGPAREASWFEAMTAAAFLLLAEERVELAILEIGLGGRCDATNLAPALLSVVTPLGLDHVEMLGGTLAAIAREKAGIFKSGRPALSAPQPEEALRVLREVAAGVGAPLGLLDPDSISEVSTSLEGTRFRFDGPFGHQGLWTPLAGRHQATNAALATLAASKLGELGFAAIEAASVAEGLRTTRWPGRLDRRSALGRSWIVDGCHNPHGARAVAEFLDEGGLAGRFVLLLGILGDKDAAGIAAPLAGRARRIVATRPPGPRGLAAAGLAAIVGESAPGRPVEAVEPLEAAVTRAAELSLPGEPILVAGSLLFAGEILRILEGGDREPGEPR
jgi:dihydrofolate synthase/folylpolyglutamate synthase